MMMPNPVGLVLLVLRYYFATSISQYSTYYTIILVACQMKNKWHEWHEWHESGTRLKQLHLILVQLVVFRALDTTDDVVDDEL